MKTALKSLLALFAIGATALATNAQPAPKILVVDLAKLHDQHYKTEEQNAKLKEDETLAQKKLEILNAEGNSLVERYKELAAEAESPAVAPEKRAKLEAEGQALVEQIKSKQAEVQNFRATTTNALQQRVKNFRDVLIEQISAIATDIAKKKGATILLDKSGPTFFGISNLLYTDPAYDITDEVLAEINKTRPAGTPAPAAAAPAAQAPAAPAGNAAPTVTFPGAKK